MPSIYIHLHQPLKFASVIIGLIFVIGFLDQRLQLQVADFISHLDVPNVVFNANFLIFADFPLN